MDGRLGVAGLLGRLAQRREQLGDPVPVGLALLQHPVVVEVGEEILSAQRQRVVASARGGEAVDLADVDPDALAVLDADAVAAGQDAARGVAQAPS